MKVISDIKNDLMGRQELFVSLQTDKTPTFEEMRQKIAEKTKKSEELIDVFSIKGSFGQTIFEVKANIYDNKELLEKVKKMQMTQKKRDEIKKAAKEAYDTKKKADEEAKTSAQKPAKESTSE